MLRLFSEKNKKKPPNASSVIPGESLPKKQHAAVQPTAIKSSSSGVPAVEPSSGGAAVKPDDICKGSNKILSAAELRIKKDLTELSLPSNILLKPFSKDELWNFKLYIHIQEGYYKNGRFSFSFTFKEAYPYEPPKVKCLQKIYHPNIDIFGNVCLNILREDWKPILSLSSVIYGIQFLFLELTHEDPLNKDAAAVLAQNPLQFDKIVRSTMSGNVFQSQKYDNVL